MEEPLKLPKLLTRQLNRLELDYDSIPSNPEKRHKILEIVSATYIETDQDRYLIERSMESSHELVNLNEKLGNAQSEANCTSKVKEQDKDPFSLLLYL